jgi:hypothetical protein
MPAMPGAIDVSATGAAQDFLSQMMALGDSFSRISTYTIWTHFSASSLKNYLIFERAKLYSLGLVTCNAFSSNCSLRLKDRRNNQLVVGAEV